MFRCGLKINELMIPLKQEDLGGTVVKKPEKITTRVRSARRKRSPPVQTSRNLLVNLGKATAPRLEKSLGDVNNTTDNKILG